MEADLTQLAFFSDPSELHRNVEAAKEDRNRYLGAFDTQLKRYHTRHFRGKPDGRGEDFLENHYHDWLSYIVPKIAYANPKVKVSTTRYGTQKDAAKALHHAANRWCQDSDIRCLLADGPAVDMQFNYGVLLVSQQPVPGARPIEGLNPDEPNQMGVPYSPKAYRIPQDQYFEDAHARQRDEIRFKGHTQFTDKRNLLAEAKAHPEHGWNVELIMRLDASQTNDKLNRDPFSSVYRGEISYDEVWVPEAELDAFPDNKPKPEGGWRKHGFNGAIYTIPNLEPPGAQGQEWLRPPRPYYGPPCGPYASFGVYSVPNHAKRLGPLTVIEEQIRDLNAHARSMATNAANYKRLIMVDKTNPRLPQIIKSAEHDYVIPIPGFRRDGIQQIELAGITQHDVAYTGLARERLNRGSHMDDARRGEVRSGVSATATAESAASGDLRVSWIQRQFEEGVRKFLWKVLWFLWHDNRIHYPLGKDAAEDLGMTPTEVEDPETGETRMMDPEPMFQGGQADDGMDFNALQLEIEPYSMERTNDTRRQDQGMAATSFVIQTAPMVAQFPFLDWKRIYQDVGTYHNIPDLGERVDVDKALQQGPTPAAGEADPVLQNKRTGITFPLASAGGFKPQPAGPGLGGTGSALSTPSAAMPGAAPPLGQVTSAQPGKSKVGAGAG